MSQYTRRSGKPDPFFALSVNTPEVCPKYIYSVQVDGATTVGDIVVGDAVGEVGAMVGPTVGVVGAIEVGALVDPIASRKPFITVLKSSVLYS
mmetsp:Transcript_23297/g.44448  ORF Transcript_23297/g.44448 Transcript_23297/m.44448 type:complete len:93 (-) Transcript_23297:1249-1527(-)